MPAQCETLTHKHTRIHTHLLSEVKQHRLVVEEKYVGERGFGQPHRLDYHYSLCVSDERPGYVLLVTWLADRG